MARVSRLAGALLVESGTRAFLVGDLKRPCDWAAAGFVAPLEVAPLERPLLELERLDAAHCEGGEPAGASLWIECEPDALESLCQGLFERLLIERNGSVSERLWGLILDHTEPGPDGRFRADWLASIPPAIWSIVRDSLLRCS